MIYLDTSVLGAIFFREAGAANLVTRLENQRKEKLMISAWTLTEMASIGGIKQRTGAKYPPAGHRQFSAVCIHAPCHGRN